MISQHIFNTISAGATGLANGAGYHIYPKKVPDGASFTRAVVYNKLSAQAVYSQLGTNVQLTCIAKSYGDAEALGLEVASLFRNRVYSTAGDVLSTSLLDMTDLPQDEESKYYLVSVTIYVKTRKALG